jgi:protein ImuB
MRRVVSLFLPNWPAERWLRAHNEGPSAPEAPLILALKEGNRRVVHAASPQARALGVQHGMAVSQAQALLPGLRVEEADPAADAEALRRLAGWCLRFSPLAAPCPADGVWIDITGCAHLHGGETELLRAIVDTLAVAGISARAALADTPGCAHAVARYGAAPLNVVPEGATAAWLEQLPVAALRLAHEATDALRRLGFERIGQLMAAPRAPLTRRFGATALRRLDQALGRAPEPLEPVLPPDLCRVRQGFPEPIATPEDLARVTAMLAEALCEKLLHRDRGAMRLDLVFQRVDGVPQCVRVGTAAPSRDAAHLTRLLKAQIETVDPGFGIESVMLAAPLTARLGARQTISDLAADATGPDLAALVDTLSNRLGPDRVFRVAPVESDIPERSLRRAPALGDLAASLAWGAWPNSLPRPPRLLVPPRQVEVVALLPDHPPVQFTWRRKPHRVRRADGPERIFGEWWRSEAEVFAVRDYFQLEDEAGQRFWLFRNGDGEHRATGDLRWFLHGVFG